MDLDRGSHCHGAMTVAEHPPAAWQKVEYVPASELRGAVDLIRELREAGIYALGPHAEHEEHERWRRAANQALDFLGGQ